MWYEVRVYAALTARPMRIRSLASGKPGLHSWIINSNRDEARGGWLLVVITRVIHLKRNANRTSLEVVT